MTVEAVGLGKSYGAVRAVDDLTFSLEPGVVTGFLGPNGAGKSTTLRLMLGLDRGEGSTLWDGRPLREHPHVTRVVGAHLDAKFFHPSRSARNHLRLLATEARIPATRVDEVLRLVGLQDVGRKRPAGFSLGMGQRLGLAGAILAEPRVLLLDEPANGLDPEGIAWLRGFLRHLAGQGRTVLVSSHVLTEVQQTVDDVVIVSRGRLVRQSSLADLEGGVVTVARTPAPQQLLQALDRAGLAGRLRPETDETAVAAPQIEVVGATPAQVGALAYAVGVELHELRPRASDLEAVFLQLTGEEAAS